MKNFLSRSCGIDLGSTYVVTGGVNQRKVSVYSPTGWTHDLPDLNRGHFQHACAKFENENGEMVGILI